MVISKKCALAISIALAVSGCSLAPAYVRPDNPTPKDIPGAAPPSLAKNEYSSIGWRNFFSDPRLLGLIETSLGNNRDLRLAILAVEKARAEYGVIDADRSLQTNAEAGGEYKKPGTGSSEKEFRAGLIPSFELDLFGRLQNLSETQFETFLASREAQRAAQILLIEEIANAYLSERLAIERIQLAERTIESRKQSLSFIEARMRSGRSSLLERQQALGLVEESQAEAAAFQRDLDQSRTALSLLLGVYDLNGLPPGRDLAGQSFMRLPVGLSSDVLLDRPDVQEAEHQLRAANANIGAARAAFFPSISLTGELGFASADLGDLLQGASSLWSFAPTISVPIFDGGRNQAALDKAEIDKNAAIAQYEKTIQTAFRDVSNAFFGQGNAEPAVERSHSFSRFPASGAGIGGTALCQRFVVLPRRSGFPAFGFRSRAADSPASSADSFQPDIPFRRLGWRMARNRHHRPRTNRL